MSVVVVAAAVVAAVVVVVSGCCPLLLPRGMAVNLVVLRVDYLCHGDLTFGDYK